MNITNERIKTSNSLIRQIFLLSLVGLTSCQTAAYKLDEKWFPLTRIEQSKTLAFETGARTIGTTMYVSNLKEWIKDHPEPKFTAFLVHEQVHAERQMTYPGGLWNWITRYVTDPAFMWAEEQQAFYVGLIYAQKHGMVIRIEKMAERMHGYISIRGPMVSKEDAEAWIRAVLAGEWKPSE